MQERRSRRSRPWHDEICCRLRTGKNGPAIKFRETEKWILCNFRKEFRHEFREIWVHGSSRGAFWQNIKQKQKRCFSPARLARTHRTGRTHSLVLFSPPTSLFAQRWRNEIHTSACARRCAHGSSWCTRCRPCSSWSRCSCSLPWRWQVVELDPQRPAALLARLSTVECGKLDALVKVAWWCKRRSGSNASPPRMRRPKAGPRPPWPPPSLQRQPLHAKFGCNRRNRQPLAGPRWAAMPTGHLSQVPPAAAGVLCRQQQVQ